MAEPLLVLVTWIDAQRDGPEWHSADSDFGLATVHSVGWMIRDEIDFITLAGSRGSEPDGDYGETISIPRCTIESISILGNLKHAAMGT